ncbi:MAG TPA: sigma-70 family RNA polymerase sigma factor [Armatimonadota bacterium]|nr:sigma-70 family RNA polymerase sigma factor [Armatimonadota bacterium]
MDMTDDRELIRRTFDGDRSAFDDIVRRYQDGLYRHLLRLAGRHEEAEDLCQEAFIRFYRALPRFNRARPVGPFLFAIATNLWRERARKAHLAEQPLDEQQPAGGTPVAEQAMARLEHEQVLAAVARLRPEQREAVSLYYDQGLSYREIASITRAPVGTVSTRLRRALESLRRALPSEAAGLAIIAGGQAPPATGLVTALQGQGAAPPSLAPAIAHSIGHAAPATVGLLHGVWTLWKEAGLMVKGIYVALGLAVVGGAVVGVPRLVGDHGASPPAHPRSGGRINVKHEAAIRAAGMQRNYEAIRHLAAEVEYTQEAPQQTMRKKFLMKYVAPSTVYFEDLESTMSPESVMPRMSVWTDGREIHQAEEMKQPSGEDLLTGKVLHATGTAMDWRGFQLGNPLSVIRGTGPNLVHWRELQSQAESGHARWARPETQFGVKGFGFLLDWAKGHQVYYWIDDVHGFIPRIVSFRVGGAVHGEQRVKEVKKAGHAWLPTRMTMHTKNDDGSTTIGEMRVLSFDANTKLSPKDLELHFKPGTEVNDEIHKTHYTVGSGRAHPIAQGALKAWVRNAQQLMLALRMFAKDHDGRLPNAATWMDDIKPYLRSEDVLRCAGEKHKYSYAMNVAVSGLNLSDIADPANMVVLYEFSSDTRNAAGEPPSPSVPGLRPGGRLYGYADGQAEFVQAK